MRQSDSLRIRYTSLERVTSSSMYISSNTNPTRYKHAKVNYGRLAVKPYLQLSIRRW